VGEQHALAGAYRGERRAQAGSADDRGHDVLRLGKRRGFNEPGFTGEDSRGHAGPCDAFPQLIDGGLIREDRVVRLPLDDLLRELRGALVRRERDDAETIRMTGQHIQRAFADGTRGTEHCHADHECTPGMRSMIRPSSRIGAAPVTLSMRSITPPWPGNRLPLSFTPAKRFSRLSVRSPTIEKATTARHIGRNCASGIANVRPNHQLPSTATSALATMPPSTPSQVLLGETLGASRRRPNLRPMKNAPISAAHTRMSANRIHSAPRSRSSRNDSSATHAGTRASTPASAADHAATQRGANITHRSATIHHTSAMLSSRSRPPGTCVRRQASVRRTAMRATYPRRYAIFGGRRNADHSHAPVITTSVTATTVASGGSQRMTARSNATSTAAV